MKIIQLSDQLINEFCGAIEYNWSPPAKYREELLTFLKEVDLLELLPFQERKRRLIKIANAKLDLNEQVYKHLIDVTALNGILFHYHDKVELLDLFNEGSKEKLDDWLAQKKFPQTTKDFISALFQPISPEETVARVKFVLSSDEKREEILCALFGSYVFACFEEEAVHRKINKDCAASYYPDFWSHLQTFYSHVLNRNCGLVVLYVDQAFIRTCVNLENAKERILTIVKSKVDPIVKTTDREK